MCYNYIYCASIQAFFIFVDEIPNYLFMLGIFQLSLWWLFLGKLVSH